MTGSLRQFATVIEGGESNVCWNCIYMEVFYLFIIGFSILCFGTFAVAFWNLAKLKSKRRRLRRVG